MKRMGKRMMSLLLAVLMTVGLLPVRATEPGGWFCLTVENEYGLLVPPERVAYEGGQTIREALGASGHVFDGLEQGSIRAVDGQAGNFTRSDEQGGYDLDRPAAEIAFFCITERMDSRPSDSLQRLIRAMAGYLTEAADVQAAARTAYTDALERYTQASSGSDALAETLAEALTLAVENYRSQLEGQTWSVAFSDESGIWKAGDVLWAENAHGRRYEDTDRTGVLRLPAGEYTFFLRGGGCGAEGTVTVTGDRAVAVALPEEDWLKMDSFQLSGSGGTEFQDSLFSVTASGSRAFTCAVPDGYSGKLYSYWDYDETLSWSQLPRLYAVYVPAGGTEEQRTELTLRSKRSSISGALSLGAAGNQVIYRACAQDAQGFTLFQDVTLWLDRTPTLRALTVTDGQGGVLSAQQAFESGVTDYTYQVLNTVDSVTILPEAFGTAADGYSLLLDGTAVPNGEGAAVPLGDGEDTQVTLTVLAGEGRTDYSLTFLKTAGVTVNIKAAEAGISVTVYDPYGQERAPVSYNAGTMVYRYRLTPGETYTYAATKDEYYHASRSFTPGTTAMTLTAEVRTEDMLSALDLGGTASGKAGISLEQPFDPARHSYTAVIPDTEPAVYLWAGSGETTASFRALYRQISAARLYDGVEREEPVTANRTAGTILKNLLLSNSGYGNVLTLRASKTEGQVTYYQDYVVTLRRELSLKGLSAACQGQEQPLLQKASGDKGYAQAVRDYQVTVPASADVLSLTGLLYTAETERARYLDNDVLGYHWAVNGAEIASGETAAVPLSGTAEPETVTVAVTCDFAPGVVTEYTVQVLKAAPVKLTVAAEPETALLFLTERLSGRRVWPDDGGYAISEGAVYDFTLTAAGYQGVSGQLSVGHDGESGETVLYLNETACPVEQTEQGMSARAELTLEKAPENETLEPDMPAAWADFRGTSYDASGAMGGTGGSNNAVIGAPLPVDADESTLYWANQLGEGFDSEAAGCPLLVDGDLITYAGDRIYRLDTVSGQIVAQGTMERRSSFAITPPAYAKGMIFVGLSDGTVQAFDAATLESLWVYHDPLKGQPNSPITVCGDYLYTGFWRSETADANFVCLSITDEDPSRGNEEKISCWRYTRKGGFYWAGAYVCGDYLLVGTDDGRSGYTSAGGSLLLLDPATGALLDSWTGLAGDVRSTVCYDGETDTFSFTSKGGCFYRVKVEEQDGGWRITDRRSLKLDNGADDPGNPPMSTSTPVVYRGRAYVGVSGVGQFTAYSGHNLTVIDLASMTIAYSVPTMGYLQSSGVLTTAYEDSGYSYIYFFENYKPGRLRVLRDKPGQKQADYVTAENGADMPYVLFTPTGEQAEYAICSPVADEYGVMYFKNDSANLMAFGSSVTLELTAQPEKTSYRAGEVFDPAGMKAELVYANGTRRDVTEYLRYSTEPLTAEDKSFTLSFPYVMYHDADTEDGHVSGQKTRTPALRLTLEISGEAAAELYGDLNGDGLLDQKDVMLMQRYIAKQSSEEGIRKAAADLNGDGLIDQRDVMLLQRRIAKLIDRFPVEN